MHPLIEKQTLSEQVRSYVLSLISQSNLNPGDEIPSEKEIIERLGVSRGVVREAFQSLSILGILDISSGKKPKIQKLNSNPLETIFNHAIVTQQVNYRQVLELRRAIEVDSAVLAAIHGNKNDYIHLRKITDKMQQSLLVSNDWDLFIQSDIAFHLALAEISQNPLYGLMLKALRGALGGSISAGLLNQNNHEEHKKIIDIHFDILYAIERKDHVGTGLKMDTHFKLTMDSF
ncbi:FadR/GntR family transcriptional regulator [Providencia heimbachae]|uniref:GntR family transcriptional regulator n=1 Tax=Providencia heimbachae ATCC 35613 TaxID=1354272 RepID=A0A1B7JZL3_9GAMM|nr:FCD domain-containing protein [Providencia heimbachae]OAT53316.1 GntR family transcriptional regulator [Providencia heimbachae ATCC 35613]SQH14053.1 L-lactate utilization operon repressor [Providencia heimbachae]